MLDNRFTDYHEARAYAQARANAHRLDCALRAVKASAYGPAGYAVTFASKGDSDYARAEIVSPDVRPLAPSVVDGATEQTPDGAQVLVSGSPRRTMPAAPLRPKRAQSNIMETPLFGQDRPPAAEQLDLG